MQNVVFTQLSIPELRKVLREEVEKVLANQPTNQSNQKTIFNLEEACQYIGISKSHCYKLTSQNLIPFSKRGKKIYFDRVELDKWLLAQKIKDVSTLEAEANQRLQKRKK
jgi:excisionase family DNA binding protein